MKNGKDSTTLLKYFFIISAFQSLAANFAHPATPTLIQNLGLNDYMFGVAFAGMSLTNFLFSPFWGKISDQIGRRKVLGISGVGYAFGQIVFGMATTELGILLGRMIAGFFIGGWNVAQLSYIMDHSEITTKGKNFTLLATIQSVCGAAGYLIGGYIAEYSIGVMFICQAVCLALGGLMFYFLCRDSEKGNFTNTVKVGEALKGANPFGAFLKVGKQMSLVMIIILAIALIATFSSTAYDQCFNYFIKDQFGLGSQYNGTIKAVIAVAILALNSTVCVYLQKKTDINKTFLPVTIANMIIIGGFLVFESPLPFFVTYVLASCVNALRTPLMQAMVAARSTPENSNAMMGFYQSMNSLGSVFGALFAGLIYAQGPYLPFILAFVAFALATGLAFIYVGKYKKEKNA